MDPDRKNFYSIRPALATDVEIVARHRALMFRDMGALSAQQVEPFVFASMPWLGKLFADREYVGWLTHDEECIVAGGGVQLRDMGPVPGCLRVGRWGHIMNIYTDPDYRRRGLASLLLRHILHWSEANHIDRLTLSASTEAKPLYESIGFTSTTDMQLSLAGQLSLRSL